MLEGLIPLWPWISGGLLILVNILNAATKHFSEHKGFVKWTLFVAELLSVLASSKTKAVLKLPLVSKPPDPVAAELRSLREK